MNSNSPFNLPRQVSAILKAPSYVDNLPSPVKLLENLGQLPKTHFSSPLDSANDSLNEKNILDEEVMPQISFRTKKVKCYKDNTRNKMFRSKSSIKSITLDNYEELAKKKSELYGDFTSRYELSPTILRRFFDITELETKYLKNMKKKVDSINNTAKNNCITKIIDILIQFMQRLSLNNECMLKLKASKDEQGMIKEFAGVMEEITSEIVVYKGKLNDRNNKLELYEKQLKDKENCLLQQEKELKQRVEELDLQLRQCKEWKLDFQKKKTQFEKYKEHYKHKLKLEEVKLKEDWDKFQILEKELLERLKVRKVNKQLMKNAPETARRHKPQSALFIYSQCHHNRRLGNGKSVDLFEGRNKENRCSNIEDTAKFY